MSVKFIRVLALAGLTVVAGAAASTITLDGAYAQAAKGGGPAGGRGGAGRGGNGGGGTGGGSEKTDRSGPEALPILAVNPNCIAALCEPWFPPRRPPVRRIRKIKEDGCGGYKPLEKVSDPMIYDPNLRCERQPS